MRKVRRCTACELLFRHLNHFWRLVLRYLPLLLLTLAIDFFCFPILQYWIADLPSNTQSIFAGIYFLIPFGLVVLLYGNDRFRWRKRNRVLFVRIYSIYQLIYLCKVVALVVIAVVGIMNAFIIAFHTLGLEITTIGPTKYLVASIAWLVPFILLPYGILVNTLKSCECTPWRRIVKRLQYLNGYFMQQNWATLLKSFKCDWIRSLKLTSWTHEC